MRISDWSSDVCSSDLITMRNIVNHPIFVRLSVRNRAPRDAGVATVRRVRFDDINVSGATGRYCCGGVRGEDPEDRLEGKRLVIRVESRGRRLSKKTKKN